MRAVVQRVSEASVSIAGKTVGAIGKGFLILLGITGDDTPELCAYLAEKCAGLRAFTDENDKMNLSLQDVAGEVLVVSQFTLYGDCRKGSAPRLLRQHGRKRPSRCTNALWRSCGIMTCTWKPANSAPIWRYL